MMNRYKVDPSSYTGVTVLPSVIAEKHIRLAGEAQLKTILYVFSDPSKTIGAEEAAEAVGIRPGEAADALEYWKNCGILLESGEAPAIGQEPETAASAAENAEPARPAEKQYTDAKPARLRMDEIAARINESKDVRLLFSEAQSSLGRTIGTGDQSSLLLLHDYYGLPVEIILTICAYAASHGKANNMNYIYTVGLDWSKREIDTIERADEELRRLESIHSHWGEFCEITGLSSHKPTQAQSKYLGIWLDEWHFPMSVIALAYEEMSKNTAGKISFQYINKVLSSWHMKGIKTPEGVSDERKAFNEKKEKQASEKASSPYNRDIKPKNDAQPASYDIDRAEKKANTSVPKLTKKEKR